LRAEARVSCFGSRLLSGRVPRVLGQLASRRAEPGSGGNWTVPDFV
jgi:hypothetical protein